MTHQEAKPQLWTSSFTLAVLTNFCIGIPFALFLPVMPVYVLQELHGSPVAAGAVNAAFMLAIVFTRAPTDRLERRLGKKRLLGAAVLLFAFSHLGYLAVGSLPGILLLRFCSGAFFALANTSIMALGGQTIPLSRKGEGLAYLTTAVSVATALGPFFGLSVAKSYGFNWVFIFSWAIALCGCCLVPFIRMPEPGPPPHPDRLALSDMFEKKALPISLLVLWLTASWSAVLSFVSVYAQKLGLPFVATYFFVALAVASIGSRLLTSRVADRFGVNYAFYPGIVTWAIGLFMLGSCTTTLALFVAAALIGYAYGVVIPALQVLALHHSPPHRTSVVTATYFTFLDGGLGTGAYLAGAFIPLFGYSALYTLLGCVVMGVGVVYFFAWGRGKGKGIEPHPHPDRSKIALSRATLDGEGE